MRPNRNECIYRSPEYAERLYIYHINSDIQDEFCQYEPINVNVLRAEFIRKHGIQTTDEMREAWHA